MPAPSSLLRLAAAATLSMALGFAVALAVMVSFPSLWGQRAFTVLSGSMEPALQTGGVVLDEPIRPREARPGDIVTFPDPSDRSRLITHRVRALRVRQGRAYVVTKGDANSTVERWNVPLDQEIGRVVYHVPKLGHVRAWVSGRWGRLALVVLVLVWGAISLVEIWRPAARAPESLP
jgi:signal peptidase I